MGTAPAEGEDVWVFAYGSLIWQPDFEFVETCKARLFGWHRSLCILSHFYRGTPDNPGLVLGLDLGGSCIGMAFRVKASGWKKTRDLLHARELINDVYRPRFQVVRLHDGRKVSAYIFVADREHIQYWRGSDDDAATLICRGVGSKGKAREYFFRTMEELRKQGIPDKRLIRLQNTILLKDGADQ